MRLKTKLKAGVCSANRCLAPPVQRDDNTHCLCAKHLDEWIQAGSPVLTSEKEGGAVAAESTSTNLASVDAQLIQPARTIAEQYLQQASSVYLDASGLAWLGAVREGMRKALAELEAQRTDITKPILESKRKVDALFKPAKDGIEAVITCCDGRLREAELARRNTQDAALAAVAHSNVDTATLVVAHGGEPVLPGQVRARDDWQIEVLDIKALALAAPQLVQVNEQAVRALLKLGVDPAQFVGLRITRDIAIVTANGAQA